jgi:hypothetical protein
MNLAFGSQNNFTDFFQVMPSDSNGKFIRMNIADGQIYCNDIGLKLPSVRDFAEFAVQFGSKVLETNYPNLNIDSSEILAETIEMRRMNFYPIHKYSKEKALSVDFYYNYSGFNKPAFMPELDGYLTSTENADWTATSNPSLVDNPVPNTFNTNGYIGPRIYRERFVTCIR